MVTQLGMIASAFCLRVLNPALCSSSALPAQFYQFNQIQIYGMAVDSPHTWESRAFAKEN